jgi:hypothetical protein
MKYFNLVLRIKLIFNTQSTICYLVISIFLLYFSWYDRTKLIMDIIIYKTQIKIQSKKQNNDKNST